MIFTPYISIYLDDDINHEWFNNHVTTKAIWIFSKNLGYDIRLRRTRVNIHLCEQEQEYIKTTKSIKSIWVKSKINTTSKVSNVEKVNEILKLIYSALLDIGKSEEWDLKSIEKAFQVSILDNGNFEWHSEIKSNKGRTSKARIQIKLEGDKAEISVEVFDNLGNIKNEIKVIDTFTSEIGWSNTFSKPKWLDDEKFGFSFLGSQLLIFADTKSNFSGKLIFENKLAKEEIEGFLRRITYKQFTDKKEMIDWITQ